MAVSNENTFDYRNMKMRLKDVEVTGEVAGALRLGVQAVTATSGGAAVSDTGGAYVAVTSAAAANIVTLPDSAVGTVFFLHVGANGFELRSHDPATVAINGGTGASAESAIPANTLVQVMRTAGGWQGWDLTAATLAGIEAAA